MKANVKVMNKLRALCAIFIATALTTAAIAAEPIPKPARVKVEFDSTRILTKSAEGEAGVVGRPVTINDPARVASISKLVGALAVMRLVEQKKIDLDRDISDYLGWRVRNPAFPDTPITMRQLLTHRTGIRDNIDYILTLDGKLESVLSNPAAWEAKYAPGSYFSYANLNSPIIAATMEGATGKRFDVLVADLVLKPLKIDACFNWGAGCSPGRRAQAVTLLRTNGDLARDAAMTGPDPCPIAPASNGSCDLALYTLGKHGSAFSPQGGLRISPAGLAKIGQVLLKGGRPILSRKAFAEMTREQWRFDGKNGNDEKGYFLRYGLGIHMHKDAQGVEWIGHVGEAYALRAGFWIDPKAKRGKMQYVTMVPAETAVGHCLDACP
jgi:CubicO group peptidase (beta-lactamase class C family)